MLIQYSKHTQRISNNYVKNACLCKNFIFFCNLRKFANLYIGWGNKYYAYNYSPPPMPEVQDQYKIGPEIMEINDPSFEEEEAYRIAHLPPPPKKVSGEETILIFII